MKVFVIQPNLSAKSEVWLFRMNQMISGNICGIAAFMDKNEAINNSHVFNLNGRKPTFGERQLIRLRLLKYDFNNTMRRELLSTIKASRADLIIVHYATTAHYLWVSLLEELEQAIFIYVHGHDIIWDHKGSNGENLHPPSYLNEILSLSKKSNVNFIVSSDCSRRSLVSIGICENKIKKKVFGVDLPNPNKSLDNPELKVLFLGRFVDYKGPDVVLEAFIKACDLGFKGRLVMAGDGPLKSMCEIIARRSIYKDLITFTGAVSSEQAKELYSSSDIYSMHNTKGILSNGYDTFGVTFIEAMSHGLSVVTSTEGGPSEIIENGVDGILVQQFNTEEHAKAFMLLYSNKDLRKGLGLNAREKVRTRYTSDIEKREFLDILGFV